VAIVVVVVVVLLAVATGAGVAASPGGNGVVAFTRFAPRSAHIFTVDSDGTHLRQLGRLHDDRSPAFSPKGTQIVFVGDGVVSLMNADGSHVRKLRPKGACPGSRSVCFFFAPTFSPDGRRIVFEETRSSKNRRGILSGTEHAGIFIMNADGSHLRQLTFHTFPFAGVAATVDAGAVFSPDGRSIAFDRPVRATHATEVFVMNADGSHVRQLTHTPHRYSAEPDFSPDGSEIVFTRTFKGKPFTACRPGRCITVRGGLQDGIFVMNADGSNVRQLTNLSLRNSTPDSSPAFSPDGQSIVFVREDQTSSSEFQPTDLFVMNADGSNLRRLTHLGTSINAGRPSWQPTL
jgi:Tol biopolymer transport system component